MGQNVTMIPLALVLGLAVGRWWIVPVASIGWGLLLLVDGSCDLGCSPGALALAAINATVGVLAHVAVRLLMGRAAALRRHLRHEPD